MLVIEIPVSIVINFPGLNIKSDKFPLSYPSSSVALLAILVTKLVPGSLNIYLSSLLKL